MIRRFIGACVMFLGLFTAAAILPVQPAYACTDTLIGIPAWYRGLQDEGAGCSIKQPAQQSDTKGTELAKFIWTIVLNVIQAGLMIVAYVTIIYLVIGGFKYMTSTGEQAGMAAAKKTITNAIIGLVIALLSAAIVNTVAGIISK